LRSLAEQAGHVLDEVGVSKSIERVEEAAASAERLARLAKSTATLLKNRIEEAAEGDD